MARWWICLVLFSGILTITSFPTEQKNGDEQPQVEFGKLLPKIIDFLQEDPNRIYFYKDFLVFDVKKNENAIEVKLQVKIICIKEEQCSDTAYLICNASLPVNDNTYIFDGSVTCDPVVIKTDLSTVTPVTVTVNEPLSSSEQQKHDVIELSHEITSQISGEQFIATPQLTVPYCTGCPETVNPTADGVSALVNSALHHLAADSKTNVDLVRVIKVERQIVAGVKYSILLEIKQAFKDPVDGVQAKYCKIDFINTPWINKITRIISNNCTISQTFPHETADDMDNEIDVNNPYKPHKNHHQVNDKPTNPDFDQMAESGSLDEHPDEGNSEPETLMSPERLAFLESQIILEQFTQETRTTEEVPRVQQTTVDNTQMAVDDIPSIFMMDEPAGKMTDAAIVTQEIARDMKVAKRQSKIPTDSKSSEDYEPEESDEELPNQKVKRFIPDSSEESKESTEHHAKQKRDLNSRPIPKSTLKHEHLYELNCQHLLEQITLKPAKSKINSNPIYELPPNLERHLVTSLHKFGADTGDFLLINDLESFQQQTHLKFNIFCSIYTCLNTPHPTLQCSPNFSEKIGEKMVTIQASEGEISILAAYDWLTCQKTPLLSVDTYMFPSAHAHRKPRGIPGGQSTISVDDERVLDLVRSALTQLDGDSAHDTKYKVVKVMEASTQVVAGSLYRIKVKIAPSDCLKSKDVDPQNCGDLKESAAIVCDLKIWDRPWLPNGRETNITCHEAGKNSRPQLYHYRSKREIAYQSDYQLLLTNIHQMQTKHITNRLRFIQFQIMHNRHYVDVMETAKRSRIFARNMATLRREQMKQKQAGHVDSATYGPSIFADIDPDEFKRTYLGLKSTSASPNANPLPKATIPVLSSIPDAIDWRDAGVVTPVKNQGACGSCWAFSVTGNIEGQYAMKHKQLLEFSEQELVDCDKTDNGCGGGFMTDAYIAIEEIGGLELESDYPYDAQDEKCNFNQSLVKVHVTNALNISKDEDDMAKWLAKNGPISIGINANAMQFYMGGVSHPWKMLCDPGNLDHGVLIVGYGISENSFFKKTKPFWAVKNSWGKRWGEQGYYRVYRGDGTCGVNLMASSAVVD